VQAAVIYLLFDDLSRLTQAVSNCCIPAKSSRIFIIFSNLLPAAVDKAIHSTVSSCLFGFPTQNKIKITASANRKRAYLILE
jgi:hypothetical protein